VSGELEARMENFMTFLFFPAVDAFAFPARAGLNGMFCLRPALAFLSV